MKKIKSVTIYFRQNQKQAVLWSQKIEQYIKQQYKTIKFDNKHPDAVLVFGGDGTILEASRKYKDKKSIIFGFNLGQVGFLASVRDKKFFYYGLNNFLNQKYHICKRYFLKIELIRNKKIINSAFALNDTVIQSPTNMVKLNVSSNKHTFQLIYGTGVLISTATGSTAYNLSAHGPIVSPDIKCLIITELFDHNLPTPSIILNHHQEISIKVIDFRLQDVVLISDGNNFWNLQKNDIIKIKLSTKSIDFAEIDDNYFLKSLHEKFLFY